MTSFDLRTEPWIRVREPRGGTREVSLLALVRDAGSITGLAGDLPTQDVAVLRLLLAVVMRSVGDVRRSREQVWADLWARRALPVEQVEQYLDRWSHRFDLLDARAPFYQVAGLHTAKGKMTGLDRLVADVPSGHRYFTTRTGPSLQRLSFAEAARWVVHTQAFDPSGIKSGAVGDDRVKGGKGYPIGTGWAGGLGLVVVEGTTLLETLLLNLVLVDPRQHPADRPAWEGETQGPGVRELPAAEGPLDLLTWQSRRVRLGWDDGGVTSVLICNGDALHPRNQQGLEQMTGWRRSEAQEKATRSAVPVYMPRTHQPERAAWRGLERLLAEEDAPSQVPADLRAGTLEWLAQRRVGGHLDPRTVLHVRTVGVEYGAQSSTIVGLTDDTVRMTADLVATPPLRRCAVDAVRHARDAVFQLANLASDLATASGGDRAAPRERLMEEAFAAIEPHYRQWLAGLAATESDLAAYVHDRLARWQQACFRLALRQADGVVGEYGVRAWTGRELDGKLVDTGSAEKRFRHRLGRALPLAAPPTPDPSTLLPTPITTEDAS